MAVDISSQLDAIKSKSGGEDVLNNIDSALEKLVKLMYPGSAIKGELTTIRESAYGKDIRMAIHDALYKLSQQEGGSSSGAIFISDPTTFRLSTNMISAIVPTECTVIGSEAFKGITSIESVVIPEGTIEIQDDAFLNCSSLLEIEIPDNNIAFGKHCFKGCESITEIDLPTNVNIKTVTEINQERTSGASTVWPAEYAQEHYESMFEGCESLTTVDMPENLWFISDGMFKGAGLTDASDIITSSIYVIGNNAFEDSAITRLVIPEGVISIYPMAFKNCTALVYADLTNLEPANNNVKLASTKATDYDSMFMWCDNLTEVKMPKFNTDAVPVGNVSAHMFSGCSKLSDITLTENPTVVGQLGFYNCESLVAFETGKVIYPSDHAFSGCTALDHITIVGGTGYTKQLEASVFDGCINLTSVSIVDYRNTSVTYSSLITSILNETFKNCTKLKNISYPDINAVVSQGDAVRIPYTVTSIGISAFQGCSAMKNFEYVIPNGQRVNLTTIGNYAFSGCTALEDLPIAKTVTSLGEGMCQNCSSLTSIMLPRNCTTIPKLGFYHCTGLRTVTINTENPSTTVIGEKYTTIGESCFEGCSALTSIELQSTIKTIASTAFKDCISLASFTLPTAVTSVGIQTFAGCTGLTSFTENAKTYSVGEKCFSGCTSLTSITLSMASIGVSAFENCTALQSATISKQTGGSAYMFDGCTSLTSITAPLWTSIGTGCFRGCVGFVDFVLPPKVTTINANAFEGCSNMVTFTPSSESNPVLRTINANAFLNCTSLTTVNLPNTMTTINSSAFAGCDGVTFNINRKENAISGYATGWGATNFTINWTGTA